MPWLECLSKSLVIRTQDRVIFSINALSARTTCRHCRPWHLPRIFKTTRNIRNNLHGARGSSFFSLNYPNYPNSHQLALLRQLHQDVMQLLPWIEEVVGPRMSVPGMSAKHPTHGYKHPQTSLEIAKPFRLQSFLALPAYSTRSPPWRPALKGVLGCLDVSMKDSVRPWAHVSSMQLGSIRHLFVSPRPKGSLIPLRRSPLVLSSHVWMGADAAMIQKACSNMPYWHLFGSICIYSIHYSHRFIRPAVLHATDTTCSHVFACLRSIVSPCNIPTNVVEDAWLPMPSLLFLLLVTR